MDLSIDVDYSLTIGCKWRASEADPMECDGIKFPLFVTAHKRSVYMF